MRRRGFTLIEVLLASTLVAVVGLAVAQVLSVSHTAQRRVREDGARRAVVAAVAARVRADLQALVPPGGIFAAGVTVTEGEREGRGEDLLPPDATERPPGPDELPAPVDGRDVLTFAVLPPAQAFGDATPPGQGAIWEVSYQVDDDPDTAEAGLVRRATRVRNPAEGSEPEPVDELAREVVGVDVRCFDGTAWQETWDSGASDTLPRAVSVRLAFVLDGRLETHEVLVAPTTARAGERPAAEAP